MARGARRIRSRTQLEVTLTSVALSRYPITSLLLVSDPSSGYRRSERDSDGRLVDEDRIQAELTDPQSRPFSQRLPLTQLIEVLDVLWQAEGTL